MQVHPAQQEEEEERVVVLERRDSEHPYRYQGYISLYSQKWDYSFYILLVLKLYQSCYESVLLPV